MSAEAELQAELLLAVDAGGTKTVACLARPIANRNHHVLGRGRSSGANPLSIGVDRAVNCILAAVDEARSAAALTGVVPDRAVLSIAGAADATIADSVRERLREAGLARQIAIVSDVLPILATVLEDGTGVALIAGTGSVAYGQHAGRQTRCGGWGYLLGDEGSGYAIGRAALQVALGDLESGSNSPRSLTQAIVDELRASCPSELTKAIYGSANPRATIAAFARSVVRSGAADDVVAQQILDEAAHDLATLVVRTTHHLSLESGEIPLALSGGVLVGSQYLRDALQRRLQWLDLNCRIKIIDDPLEGCLKLAALASADDQVRWS